ncbi:hypothetical protein JOC78_003380 [Bacillus ectoiniformans]|uniref:Wadjet anti-phage system protein JetD domain-containing protein n=1 Tax=Bacillus ectoiniformans TaxID=1494429 RepID=UPI0019578561|nr:Wadjet anti-phage system protein JetD domain-containing protein [Bacillus ectoiniformans]MBM7650390.1 hypothetical protein [Bacillus ectoiniformans]
MIEYVKKLLFLHSKKTISLIELEELLRNDVDSYEKFVQFIQQLENEQVLHMVKSKGRTSRTPSLALQYRINKGVLASSHHTELQRYRLILHPSMNIDEYYRHDASIFQQDLPYILKLDKYLKHYGFPVESVPAPERSFALVGDEKWIVEKGGKELLERLQLFEKLQIVPVSEPLMFAINPKQLSSETQLHLIVENKTTYQGLLLALEDMEFATLIYGGGKAVIKSIDQFSLQYSVQATHHFFYFGDLDLEGITIWHSLTKRQLTQLAMPFYHACLQKQPAGGKEYQRENKLALEQFLTSFSPSDQDIISTLLSNGQYYPQEILKTTELQRIGREADWKALISKI